MHVAFSNYNVAFEKMQRAFELFFLLLLHNEDYFLYFFNFVSSIRQTLLYQTSMRKICVVIFIVLLVGLQTHAQSHEFGVGINTGYSFFGGSGSESHSFVINDTYTNSPLGKELKLSYGLSVDYKYIFRNNIILGAEIAYEDLRTKVNINGYHEYGENHKSSGKTILHNYFLNGSPFVGYRFNLETFSFDILAGLDVAYSIDREEKVNYKKEDGRKKKFTKSRKDDYVDIDLRPRLQLNFNYKNYTLFTGASFGVMNYYKDWVGSDDVAYLNTIRLGFLYRFYKTINQKKKNVVPFYL